MKRTTSLLGLLLAGSSIGCSVGNTAKTFQPALRPAGIGVEVRMMSGRELFGELLAAEEGGLVVLSSRRLAPEGIRLVHLPYRAIRKAEFRQLGSADLRLGAVPRRSKLERMRRVSRYPQGLSDDLLARLLALYGQAEVETLEP